MQATFHSGCHKPVAVFSSEVLKLLSVPAVLPPGEGTSQRLGTFPLSQLLPRGTGLVLITFPLPSFFSFVLPVTWRFSCLFRSLRSSASVP